MLTRLCPLDRASCAVMDDFGAAANSRPRLDGEHCTMVQFHVVGARGTRRPARTRTASLAGLARKREVAAAAPGSYIPKG